MRLLKQTKRNKYYLGLMKKSKVFVKEYLNINPKIIKEEYNKAKILYSALQRERIKFIKPVFFKDNYIGYEWIENCKNLKEKLSGNKSKKTFFYIGQSLQKIHKTPQTIHLINTFRDTKNIVFLHGDFTIKNIFVSNNNLIIGDASISEIINKNTVYLEGNLYRDISLFTATLKLSSWFSIKGFFKIKERKWIRNFIKGYFSGNNQKYDVYEHLKVEKEYFKKLIKLNHGRNFLTRFVKRTIYKWEVFINNRTIK